MPSHIAKSNMATIISVLCSSVISPVSDAVNCRCINEKSIMFPIGKDMSNYATVGSDTDRYLIECRPIGGYVWTSTAGYREPMDSATAGRVAAELNLLSERVVYRAYLVEAAQ